MEKYRKTRLVLAILVLFSFIIISYEEDSYAVSNETIESYKNLYKRPKKGSVPHPENNPYNEAKHNLGRMLFFDPRISNISIMSCATCHHPGFEWTDALKINRGQGQREIRRNTPTIVNLAWEEKLFWDGRVDSLEEQARTAIESENEMFITADEVADVLSQIPGYKKHFEEAFPGDGAMTLDNVVRAIATFEREVVSAQAPFDKWIDGDEKAISESAKRGFVLFNTKGNCSSCHTGWRFADGKFHDVGLETDDLGRAEVIKGDPKMLHAFRTPTLRQASRTMPYFHNGAIDNLKDVVEFFNRGGAVKRDTVEINPLNLDEDEVNDLVAFIETLTSEDPKISFPILPRKYDRDGVYHFEILNNPAAINAPRLGIPQGEDAPQIPTFFGTGSDLPASLGYENEEEGDK